MEKYIKVYNLERIKKEFSKISALRITSTALKNARSIGFTAQDIVDTIQQLKRNDFVKSMTTFDNHKVWQDVYNTKYNGYVLYIKFQIDEMGHFIISFKEK